MSNKQYYLSGVPSIHRARSSFPLKYDIKTSMNIGSLRPIAIEEVYPGDTWKAKMPFVARGTSTFVKPVMDSLTYEQDTFFVPMRLLWTDWEKFITGGNGTSSWSTPYVGTIPSYPIGTTFPEGTVFDFLGYPTKTAISRPMSVLPVRALAKIWNDFYRSEAVDNETVIQTGAYSSSNEAPNTNSWSASNYSGKCPPVSKMFDYFTACLPSPQKGQAQGLPFTFVDVPVVGDGFEPTFKSTDVTSSPLQFDGLGSMGPYVSYIYGGGYVSPQSINWSNPHLTAQTSNLQANATISDLRMSVQLQKIYERSARYGSRLVEYIRSAFGVTVPDSRVQRAEFLGGASMPLSQTQVATTAISQSSGGAQLDPASLSSYSHSQGYTQFAKSFTEHGYLITVGCIRYKHNYSQGIRKMFARQSRFDFYDPTLSHISEQPVYTTELFASASKDARFGFLPCWDELRHFPSRITGQMRSNATASLDVYHFGDNYSNAPSLTSSWLHETSSYVDRTLSVQSSAQDPFIFDIACVGRVVRVLPLYGTPELIDHF